jgi:uncharacterized Zn finger protein (UPF0148 family)
MFKLNGHARCPECNARSRVVWISKDGKQMAIQCQRHHSQITRGDSMLGSTERRQTRSQKNMVFLVATDDPASTTTGG